MPRRGSNIYKRKDGRFEGRVPIGHKEDGSLKYKFLYARTLSEVKEKMAQFQAVLQSQPVSALKLKALLSHSVIVGSSCADK